MQVIGLLMIPDSCGRGIITIETSALGYGLAVWHFSALISIDVVHLAAN